MKKYVRMGVYALLGVALSTGFVGCSDDDPDYSSVTPPTVNVTYSISGRVTSMDGKGLSATVSLDGKGVGTQSDGTFVFENVSAGTHTLTAEADGKMPKETTVTVGSGSSNAVWNVALPNEGTVVDVVGDGDTSASVASETVEGNEAGEVTVDVEVPQAAVPAGSQIVITPLYSMEEGVSAASRATTRAAEDMLLIGTNVSCTDASVSLAEPITLSYDVDPEVASSLYAQKLVNGTWERVACTVDGGKVTVVADSFTSYSLMLGVNVTTSVSREALSFTQSEWDNLYGSREMTVGSASFTYHVGTEITTDGTSRLTGYLVEILARMAGASVTTVTGTYPLNVTLPIGTALTISGTQEVTTVSVSALNRSVSGRQYGDLNIEPTTYNREHTGGGNGSVIG